nr:PREDICTED: enoyl-CoA hydratase, mitochondrial-like isoform X2 [Lepisosteus oculatus]
MSSTLARRFCTRVSETRKGNVSLILQSVYGRKIRQITVKPFSASSRKGQAAAAPERVVAERKGPVLTVGINRPEVRNAVDRETARQLLGHFEAFEEDSSLAAAVLYGVGGNFCSGYDLKELAHHSASIKLEQDVTKGPGPMGPSRMQLSKPVIAAVSGYAVAGGLELALLADLRVMEESAIVGVFCRRFALQAALALAKEISEFPQQCLRADRASAYHSAFDAPCFSQALQFELDHSRHVILEEAVAGAKKFDSGTGRGGTFS